MISPGGETIGAGKEVRCWSYQGELTKRLGKSGGIRNGEVRRKRYRISSALNRILRGAFCRAAPLRSACPHRTGQKKGTLLRVANGRQ